MRIVVSLLWLFGSIALCWWAGKEGAILAPVVVVVGAAMLLDASGWRALCR